MPFHRSSCLKRGFTLLELLVVVTILALIAATAATQLGGTYRNAEFRRTSQILQEIDRIARQTATAQEKAYELRIDLSNSQIEFQPVKDSASTAPRIWKLTRPIVLKEAMTRREQRTTGVVVVRFDRRGRSDSYGILLNSVSGSEQWHFFSGITGQFQTDLKAKEIEKVLDALSENGLNAD